MSTKSMQIHQSVLLGQFYLTLNNATRIQQEILANGSLEVLFVLHPDLYNYESGIYIVRAFWSGSECYPGFFSRLRRKQATRTIPFA